MKLLLWDIDGTLLNCNRAGRHALTKATLETFGSIGKMEHVDFQGKTDPLILHESLIHMGFDPEMVKEKEELLKERYFAILEESIEEFSPIVMPGIPHILDLLEKEGFLQGILTGNFQRSAWIKLRSRGLEKFFHTGAFGDDGFHRNDLPEVALKRMNEQYDSSFHLEDLVIIGDTLHDIHCAKHAGAFSVAVGTGFGENKLLKDEDPHLYFHDLSDTEKVLSSLMNI